MSKFKIRLIIAVMATLATVQGGSVRAVTEEVPLTIESPTVDRPVVGMDEPIVEVVVVGPTIYNIPLDESLQRYTSAVCEEYGVGEHYELILALMWKESTFCATSVSATNDYGIMQINVINHDSLRAALGTTDFLNAEQNIRAGIYMISKYLLKYDDVALALMAYNQGEGGAQRSWAAGTYSSDYSRSILAKLELIQANNYQ